MQNDDTLEKLDKIHQSHLIELFNKNELDESDILDLILHKVYFENSKELYQKFYDDNNNPLSKIISLILKMMYTHCVDKIENKLQQI